MSLKILLVGNSNVGKSSIMKRFIDNKFYGNYCATIGLDFATKEYNNMIRLQIWDFSGLKRFQQLPTSYCQSADAIILVYDITNSESFSDVQTKWIPLLNVSANNNNKTIVIVGSKLDEEQHRLIPTKDLQNYAESNQFRWMETSAKYNVNIDELFQKIVDTQSINKKTPVEKEEAKENMLQKYFQKKKQLLFGNNNSHFNDCCTIF